MMTKKRISLRNNPHEDRGCWSCKFAEPFDAYWNKNLRGEPITKHCIKTGKKGIMKNCNQACSDYAPE